MACDLGRFLEQRPIAARRPTVLRRSKLWVRRNPAVSATLAALIVGVIGLVAGLWQVGEARGRAERGESEATRHSAVLLNQPPGTQP